MEDALKMDEEFCRKQLALICKQLQRFCAEQEARHIIETATKVWQHLKDSIMARYGEELYKETCGKYWRIEFHETDIMVKIEAQKLVWETNGVPTLSTYNGI
jgi:hypothetical protein